MSIDTTEIESNSIMGEPVWTFERFIAGSSIGSTIQEVTSDELKYWETIYGINPSKGDVPLGLVQVKVMSAYTDVVQPRPKGNIHLGQRVEVRSVPPIGRPMLAAVGCKEKRQKRDKNLVLFQVKVSDQASGDFLFEGALTIAWAV